MLTLAPVLGCSVHQSHLPLEYRREDHHDGRLEGGAVDGRGRRRRSQLDQAIREEGNDVDKSCGEGREGSKRKVRERVKEGESECESKLDQAVRQEGDDVDKSYGEGSNGSEGKG